MDKFSKNRYLSYPEKSHKILGDSSQIIQNRREETKILELAKFIGFQEPNVEEIIKNSSLEATIERRKAKCEAAGYPFYEIICYRKVSQKF